MKRLIMAELERIFYRKSTKVLFAISILYPIFTYLLYQQRWGFYTDIVNGTKFPLNSLNFSVYNLTEYNILLVFVLLPLLLTESLSSEIESGFFRLILIRPIKKWKLLIAKWIAVPIVYALMLISTFFTKLLIGFLFLPKVTSASYYNLAKPLNFIESMLYNIKYYVVIFLLHIIMLWVVSMVSVILKKTVLTYIGSVGLVIGCVYLYGPFSNIFLQTTDYSYSILGNDCNITRLLYILPVTAVLAVISIWRWNRNIGYRA